MRTFLISLFILIFSLINASLYAEEIWKLTSLDWEPYSGSELEFQGKSIKILKDLLKEEGITLVVEFYPWSRSQHLAKTKDYIGYFPAWPEEVKEGFTASPPVDWSEIAILKNSEQNADFTTIDDLFKNHKIGLINTYAYPEDIAIAAKKYPHHMDMAPNETSLMLKLSQKRHPFAITDPNVMFFTAARHKVENIEIFKHLGKKELLIALRQDEDNMERIRLLKKILSKE